MIELNNMILNQASKLDYIVKDIAPSDLNSILSQGQLVIWSGESNNTAFNDARVNHAFRALHDQMHIDTRLDFTPIQEIELGCIQANKYSGLLADLIYIEVSLQAEYFLKNGVFVSDQKAFTLNELKKLGYKGVK